MLPFSNISCSKQESVKVVKIRWAVDPAPNRKDEIAGFEKINPNIKVELSTSADPTAVLTQIAGGVPPDLISIYSPSMLRQFMEKNALTDLMPYIERYQIALNDFWPALSPYMYYEEKVYGLPPNCGPFVLFYNKDMFDKEGLTYPEYNWTWRELLEVGKKLTKVDVDKKEYGQFGLLCEDALLFIYQNGGKIFRPDSKRCVINSDEAKEGLRFYHDLRFKHHIMPRPSEIGNMQNIGGWGGSLNLFASKKVAMLIQGRWMSMVFRKDKSLKWNIAPVPQGKEKVTLLASKIYAIPYNSKHKEEAAKFLHYLIDEEDQLIIAKSGDGIPSRISFAKSKEFLFEPAFPDEDKNEIYLNEMHYAKSPEFSSYIADFEVVRILGEEFDLMNNLLQTPEESLDKVAERINTILEKNLDRKETY